MDSPVNNMSRRRGRPRKFSSPSRAVTLTLPLPVVDALSAIDSDLSRAVVRLTQPVIANQPHPPAELAVFGRRAVIIVNPTRTLEERTGIDLVPLPDGRALISFDSPGTIAALELRIEDAIEDRRLSRDDQAIFEAIAGILKTARRSNDTVLVERNIIVLEARRPSALARTTRRGLPAKSPRLPRRSLPTPNR
ncbi:MAG: hypothetical protein LC753_13220 [Acidobacteria bacterium]|nr:hypothetical protein [Acidobacteriota bacterium]MCA1651187.1 hypothetical protein [Acidobacteriota bacterium]